MELRLEEFDFKKELNKQRNLFHNAFPEVTDSSIEKYLWLMHEFPNNIQHSFEYCSFIKDEMVGYYAAIPYRYKIGSIITDVGMVCGVMTSSEHRGKGIFTQMGKYSTEKLAEKVPFTTGYPIRKSVIPGHLKVGWKIAFELPLYIKFLKLNSFIKGKFHSFVFFVPMLNLLLNFYNSVFRIRKNGEYNHEIYTNILDIRGYDEFIYKYIEDIPNALIKDSIFAKWRYGGPDKKYQFLVIRKNELIIGFSSFTKVIKESVPSYCLLDLSILPEYINCIGLIYDVLTKEAKKNNIEAIMFMMSKYSAKKYQVKRNAFLKSPYSFYLIIKNLTNSISNHVLFNEENWHLMWVDSDDL